MTHAWCFLDVPLHGGKGQMNSLPQQDTNISPEDLIKSKALSLLGLLLQQRNAMTKTTWEEKVYKA